MTTPQGFWVEEPSGFSRLYPPNELGRVRTMSDVYPTEGVWRWRAYRSTRVLCVVGEGVAPSKDDARLASESILTAAGEVFSTHANRAEVMHAGLQKIGDIVGLSAGDTIDDLVHRVEALVRDARRYRGKSRGWDV
jgi:hypothetical protein